MFERGATLRAARAPLAGLSAQLLLMAALALTVGLGPAGWIVGAASALILDAALARALWRNRPASLGPAGWVTLTRATLAVGVAALTASSFEGDTPVATLVTLASVALALDFVDGWIARRTKTASALGASFDGEVDAFLILALSVEVAHSAGMIWVLAIGMARYVFLAAGWPFAWMSADLPRREWRKTVTAAQGVALTIAAAEVLPLPATRAVLAVALALLAESFGRDVWWLWRHRHAAGQRSAAVREHGRGRAVALTLLALVVVWVALVAPNQPWRLTPGAFVRLPLEAIVGVLLVVVLPAPARRFVPWLLGPVLGLLVLVKLLDIGFFIAFDRPFNPVDDWSYAPIGVETVRDTFGRTDADLTVAGAVLIVIAALALPTLAMLRLTTVAARHRLHSLRAVGVLSAAWVACWAFGAELVPGASVASTSAADLAVHEVQAVQSGVRDRARFEAALRNDNLRIKPGRLLSGLRGKDVLIVFVEGYGKLTLEGSPFSPGMDAFVDGETRRLAAAGFSARSGWITSPGFGGASWLAQSTLQSGTWVDTQGRYKELVKTDRLTLTEAFRRAGWRTVADMPANNRDWPVGLSFYHFDKVYDRRNLGYRGPKYAYAPMPDQYLLLALQRDELAKPHRRPLFAEIATVSSHEPWTRVPRLIGWKRVGDGSIFNRLPVDKSGLGDPQEGYVTSIKYTLRALISFVEHYGGKDLVLVMLGDEQPSRIVGGHPGHDVPISVIAHDPAVMRRIAGWGWVDGMRPTSAAPVWLMSAFRNRFLRAFSSVSPS